MGKHDGVTKEQQMAALKKLIRELGGKSQVANILGLKEGKVGTGKNMKWVLSLTSLQKQK